MPQYLFETSWEVCNRVGGIYAVLSTRARQMQSEMPDRVVFFGPDLGDHSDRYFHEDKRLFRSWRQRVNNSPDLPQVRVGRWQVPGQPIAVLVRYDHLWSRKDDIYRWAWEQFGVQSHAAYGDYDDSCLFGYAVGQAMQTLSEQLSQPVIAHTNEWQTGFTIFYLRAFCPSIRTLFTTHATGIGRSIAGNGKPLYDYFTGYHGDQMAEELNMVSKHSVEKQAAHYCHCFTTVSELTARECTQLLDKSPDIVTPNGFEPDFVPQGKDYTRARKDARTALIRVAQTMTGKPIDNPLMLAIAGRLEWKNKGIDVYLQAMEQLALQTENEVSSVRPIVAFLLIPYLEREIWTRGRVTIISLPYYLPVSQETMQQPTLTTIQKQVLSLLQDKSYYDLLVGMDLTVFPSYYEPWGYTPMESIAFHIPTITTDLAGYGVWAAAHAKTLNQPLSPAHPIRPITVLHRTDSNSQDVVNGIISTVKEFAALTEKQVQQLKRKAEQLSKKTTWEQFFPFYQKAYRIALQKKS